jgi:excisionase family DNA binding protein
MGYHHPNPRVAKTHRSYTVDEAARLVRVHKNTVRAWIKAGLRTIDARRPILIAGRELRRFLEARRKTRKQPCGPGQLYCVCCRAPKAPAGATADYITISNTSGNLRGLCPDCGNLIHRRVAHAKVDEFRAFLNIIVMQALPSIRETDGHSLNCDSKTETHAYADKQPG